MNFDKCIFDIETDALLDDVTKVHCIALLDADTNEVQSFHGAEIKKALYTMSIATTLIGHNILCFDLPVLKKLYNFEPADYAEIVDTLVCTHLVYPDLKNDDFKIKPRHLPMQLYGRHSLEAWGFRLGVYKGEFCKTTDWADWSTEMEEYCQQDVRVTKRLYDMILAKNYSQEALDLEHQFQQIIFRQEQFGFCFNQEAAVKLYATLSEKRDVIKRQLQEVFPPKEEGEYFVPKRDNRSRGYKAGEPVWRGRLVPFNPGSRTHIADRLKDKYGWTPTELTETGAPRVDEEVLSGLEFPECRLLTEYLMLDKRIGQLAEGNQAWLKSVGKDGRIHGQVNTNGAVTGRCTHHHPNIAQVPAVGAEYGEECRRLFGPPVGYYQLGCDASGLELRCLAHYMARYDNGAYRDVLLTGDIHTHNQKAAGLATRAEAKRFIYAFLYGAGDTLIGSLIDPSLTDNEARAKLGKQVKAKFLKGMPALAALIQSVQDAVKNRGYLKGLDGRVLTSRSQHSALNLLLQSAGAVVMKKATCILWDDLTAAGFEQGKDVAQMAHIHDEYQLAVRHDIAKEVIGDIAVNAIRKAGEYFNFRCPLDGEYKVGQNWAECH